MPPARWSEVSKLDIAHAVVAGVKARLPADQFDVADDTLFISATSVPSRAVFAVALVGIPRGLIPVEFDVPQTAGALAKELADTLLLTRQQWDSNTPTLSPVAGLRLSAEDRQQPAASTRSQSRDSLRGAGMSEPEQPVAGSPVTTDRSGLWLLTTRSGARLVLAVVVDPATMNPIVTVTRYAAAGQGDEFNGAPLSVDIAEPPMIGRRLHAKVIATDAKYPGHEEIVYGGPLALYWSTPVTGIQELTYDMLVVASGP
jgi:hypothetical protein